MTQSAADIRVEFLLPVIVIPILGSALLFALLMSLTQ